MANDNQPEHKPIEKKVFDSFFADLDTLKERKDKAGTDIAQKYDEHKNTYGMHTKVAKVVYTLLNMEADKRADWLRAFDEYRDTVGLDDQLDLFDDEKEAA